MRTRPTVIPFQSTTERDRHSREVARHLREDGLILYPTETVYGLGCALSSGALDRLAELKGRGSERPFLLLIAGRDQIGGVRWTEAAERLADAFWPGPLTLVLGAEEGAFPARVVGPRATVAVRVSPHPAVRAIIDATGGPITSTSANRQGEPPVLDTRAARALLHELDDPRGLWLLDGGTLPASAPSTIVDCTQTRARVLRHGELPLETLKTVVKEIYD